MREMIPKRLLPVFSGIVVVLLVIKYFWSMYVFPDVPFGYDAGIYRYLFLRHSIGLPPFDALNVAPWARAHAPGLFFFSSILMHLGMPVDVLIGALWNIFPVVLACALALCFRKSHGDLTAFFILLAALLSTVQYEGFLMMYYKTLVALLWCALAFTAFERDSIVWVPLGMFTIATHQQIGLIFTVAIASSIASSVVLQHRSVPLRRCAEFFLTIVFGLLWYLPTYQHSLYDIAPKLLESGTLFALLAALLIVGGFSALIVWLPQKNRRVLWVLAAAICVTLLSLLPVVLDSPSIFGRLLTPRPDAISGAFFSLPKYLFVSLPLLLAGIAGLVLSLESKRGSTWQWAVLWCAVATLGMFFFYRRFILPFDFFLLPFAGIAFAALWKNTTAGRAVLAVIVFMQGGLLLHQLASIDPVVKPSWLTEFAALPQSVPDGSTVVVMDNMAPWVVGFLPDSSVSGPGIFDSLPLPEWEKFLLGSDTDRAAFFGHYPKGTFFYATEVFHSFYPPEVLSVLSHSCLKPVGAPGLFASVCGR